MASWKVAPSPAPPTPLLPLLRKRPSVSCGSLFFFLSAHRRSPNSYGGRSRASAAPASEPEGVGENDVAVAPSGSLARSQLDLLEQLVSPNSSGSGYETDGSRRKPTIREQLSELVGDRGGVEFTLPLGKRLKASVNTLTISQKRNIKRQAYLNEVSGRNDSVFFATIGAFVLVPPLVILAVAILTGYVQLLP